MKGHARLVRRTAGCELGKLKRHKAGPSLHPVPRNRKGHPAVTPQKGLRVLKLWTQNQRAGRASQARSLRALESEGRPGRANAQGPALDRGMQPPPGCTECCLSHETDATTRSQGYLHKQVGEEAAQPLKGALHSLQLFARGGEVETGEEHLHTPRLGSGLMVQPQQLQTRRSPCINSPRSPLTSGCTRESQHASSTVFLNLPKAATL